MTTPLRIAGVPEAFNDAFDRIDGSVAQFVSHPGGSGAMLKSLSGGEVDAAFLLTDCAVAAIASRAHDVRIVSPVVSSPLIWGVVTNIGNKTIKPDPNDTWAVSRRSSGSDVMLRVWASENAPQVLPFGNFDAMCTAVVDGDASAFLWEIKTTKGLLRKKGERRLAVVDQVVTPWPAFCCAVRSDCQVVGRVRALVAGFLTAADAWSKEPDVSTEIENKYGMSHEEAAEWLRSVRFAAPADPIDLNMLDSTMQKLKQAGVIPKESDISSANMVF